MPFTIPLIFGLFKHRCLAVRKALYRQDPFHFVDKNTKLTRIKNQEDKYIFCPICGFSMAEILLNNGWRLRECSATDFNRITSVPGFDKWLADFDNKMSDQSRAVNSCQ